MNSLKRVMGQQCAVSVLAVLSVFFMFSSAWALDSALGSSVGLVVDISPEVWLQRGTEKSSLALQGAVAAEDTLITGPNGRVQVLFEDDTVLTLGPSSQVLVAEYLYDGTADSHLEFDFAAGLSRVVTGKMVEANREGFKMRTPLSTMGIRGTMLSVLLPTLEGAQPENAIASGSPEKVVLEQIGAGHNLSIQSAGVEVTMNRAGITAQVSPGNAPGLAPTTAEESRVLQALAPTAKAQKSEQPAEPAASPANAKADSAKAESEQEDQGSKGSQTGAPAEGEAAAGKGSATTSSGAAPTSVLSTPSGMISMSQPKMPGNNGQITTPNVKPENPSINPGPGNNQPGTGVIDPIVPTPPKAPVDNGGGSTPAPLPPDPNPDPNPDPVPDPVPDPDPGTGNLPIIKPLSGSITQLAYSVGQGELKYYQAKKYELEVTGTEVSPIATLRMNLQMKNETKTAMLSPYLSVNGRSNRITTGPNGTRVEFGNSEEFLGYFLGKSIRSMVVDINQVGEQLQHNWSIATGPEPFIFSGLLAPDSNINSGLYTQDMAVMGLQIGKLELHFNFENNLGRAYQANMKGMGVAESDFCLSQTISPKSNIFRFDAMVPTGSGPQTLFGSTVTGGTALGVVDGHNFGGGSWTLTTDGVLVYSGSSAAK